MFECAGGPPRRSERRSAEFYDSGGVIGGAAAAAERFEASEGPKIDPSSQSRWPLHTPIKVSSGSGNPLQMQVEAEAHSNVDAPKMGTPDNELHIR